MAVAVATPVEWTLTAHSRSADVQAPGTAGAGEDLHDTGDCVGAVQHAHRAADDLDAIDVFRAQMSPVEGAAGQVDLHTIHEYLHVIAFTTAHEERRQSSRSSTLRNRCAGDEA